VPYRSLEGSVNMNFLKREDAVSPVIGVILMVAITVILAAVIAAFVFGMASNVQKTKNVAVTAKKVGTTIMVTYDGGQDDASLAALNFTMFDNGTVMCSGGSSILPTNCGTQFKPYVGQSYVTSCQSGGCASSTHVTATGVFIDGTSQVLLDTYV